MTLPIIVLIVVVTAELGALAWIEVRTRLRIRALASRQELSEDAMAVMWEGRDLSLVREIAGDLKFQAGRLRPEDKLYDFNTSGFGDDSKIEAVLDRICARRGVPPWDTLIHLSEIVDYLSTEPGESA